MKPSKVYYIQALIRYREKLEEDTSRIYTGTPKIYPEILNRINSTIEEAGKDKEKAREIISRVSDPIQRDILTYRYIDFLSWYKISKKLPYYEITTLYRIHNKALSAFNAIENNTLTSGSFD